MHYALTKDFHLQYLGGWAVLTQPWELLFLILEQRKQGLGEVKQLGKFPQLLRGTGSINPISIFKAIIFPHNSRLLPINTYPG